MRKVQLRNLVTGKVAHGRPSPTTMASIEFLVDDPGTYVVEMVMVDGYVLALSNAGSLARYETLQTPWCSCPAAGTPSCAT